MSDREGLVRLARERTQASRLLLMSGLTFHSGRRLADSPELLDAVEAEARETLKEKHEPLWTEHGYIVCRCGWEYDDPAESYFDHITAQPDSTGARE